MRRLLTLETGFHDRVAGLTDDLVDYEGYWLANSFGDPGAEYQAVRGGVGVIDLSALRKWELRGPDAEVLAAHCVTRDVRRLANGQMTYTAMCAADGGMIDDGTLLRLGDTLFRWVGGSDAGGQQFAALAKEHQLNVEVTSSTATHHNIAVQGPLSRHVVAAAVWTPPIQPDVAELGWFRIAVGRLGGYEGTPVVVTRTGYSGELGYEVWCHPRDGVEVWDAILDAGAQHGIQPYGLEALDTLRVEAGLIFAGYEFTAETDPYEAGIGFTVPLASKADDFVGRDALIRRRAKVERNLVGLQLDGKAVAALGDPVSIADKEVGAVTSGVWSPHLEASIALAQVAVASAAIGTKAEVACADGSVARGRVVATPFYDPTKSRIRA